MTDDELMELIARGDEEAARLLVERWERPVFVFLERMVGSRDDAQDLGQETFVKICRDARRYTPSGRFRSWLFRIAGNHARSRLRRKRILSWVSFSPGAHDRASTDEGPDVGVERDETRLAVRRALAKLSARQREAIVLRYYQDLRYREIATAMGVSIPAVESLLQRGMAALRKEMARGSGEMIRDVADDLRKGGPQGPDEPNAGREAGRRVRMDPAARGKPRWAPRGMQAVRERANR